MSNGTCKNAVLKCPLCGDIWGGFAEGNYYRDCQVCTEDIYKTCSYKYGGFDGNYPEPYMIIVRVCPQCIMYLLGIEEMDNDGMAQ